jgi:S-methylmethionine-dependent homocysteine/selenocysteine methylase
MPAAADGKPFWVSFTLKDEDVDEVPRCVPASRWRKPPKPLPPGRRTLLFNCSQPEVIGAAIDAAKATFERLGADIAIGAYANAFPPSPRRRRPTMAWMTARRPGPAGLHWWAQNWRQRGASLVGGCCGIGPEHIAELKAKLI